MAGNKADRHAMPTANADPIRLDLRCHRCLGRSLNVCSPLDDSGLVELLGLGAVVHRRKGELLFRAGDRQGPFFKITKGVVAVSSSLNDGRRQVVALRVPGDVVGYLAKSGKYAFEGETLTEVKPVRSIVAVSTSSSRKCLPWQLLSSRRCRMRSRKLAMA